MSHFLGEDFGSISSRQGVAIIIIMDKNKCIQAAVLTQSVSAATLHWYLLV